jgi:hypothetical protein
MTDKLLLGCSDLFGPYCTLFATKISPFFHEVGGFISSLVWHFVSPLLRVFLLSTGGGCIFKKLGITLDRLP